LPLDDADVVLLIGRKNWGGKSGDEDRHQLLPILHRRRCRSLRGRRPFVTRSAHSTAVAAGLGYLLLGIVPFFAAPIAGVQNSGLYAPRRTPLARSPPRKRPSFAPAERPDASSLQTAAVAMRPSMALRPKTPSRPEKSRSVSLTLSHSLPCMAPEKHITGGSVSPRYRRANGLVTRTGPVGCIISPSFFLLPAVRVVVRIRT